jgi:hypothetical protein
MIQIATQKKARDAKSHRNTPPPAETPALRPPTQPPPHCLNHRGSQRGGGGPPPSSAESSDDVFWRAVGLHRRAHGDASVSMPMCREAYARSRERPADSS